MALSNSEDAFSFQRMMLQTAGIWPRKNPNLLHKIHCIACFLVIAGLAGILLLSVVLLKKFSPLIQCWAMFVSIFNVCLKFGIFYYKTPLMVKLLKSLRSSHFNYYETDLDVHIQRSIRIATVMVKSFLISALLTVLSISLAPLVNPEPRQVPFPFPFDLTNAPLPVYLSIYLFQALSLSTAAWVSTGFDNLATALMCLAAGYFRTLKITIMRVTDLQRLLHGDIDTSREFVEFYGKFDKTINDKLSVYVEHHLAVIRFTELIESVFSYIVLLQFLVSAIGSCLAGFTFISAPVGSYEFAFALSLPITILFQISLYCIFGNEVTIESAKIGDACYMTEWIGCGPLVRKSLFIIMERSKRPLILTAGKFINLSLTSLVSLFRSAVSYAMVLKQLTNKDMM